MLYLLTAFLAIQAQDEVRVSSHPYAPTLRVDTRVVEVAAVVRDAHGKAIAGLTKGDFHVLDDGKARLIDHFVVENALHDTLNDHKLARSAEDLKSELPAAPARPARFLALFIDDINGKDEALAADLPRTQTAAEKFVKDALKSGVRIGVFTASGEPKLDFTTDQAKLMEAIAAVKPHIRMRETGLTLCPRITPYLAYRIVDARDREAMRSVMYDAGMKNCPVTTLNVFAQAEETWRQVKQISADTLSSIGNVVDYLGKMPGKREMIMASSGFLAGTMQAQKDQVIGRALHADVVISALDSKAIFGEEPAGLRPEDPVGYLPTPGGRQAAGHQWTYQTIETPLRLDTLNDPLWNLAEGTGGVFFHNNNDLAAGFRKLGNTAEVTYRLSFRPDGVAADGSYHKLKVTAKGYSVQARPGYFAPSEKDAGETLQSKIDREIMAEDAVSDFPVRIAIDPGTAALSVIVSVDISKLRFSKQGDREVQKIAFVSALIDVQGKIAVAKEGLMDLSLTEATYERLKLTGVNAKISLQAPAGSYKLRQVSEEGVDGRIACSSHAVEIK
jgi:VWFA-related protein